MQMARKPRIEYPGAFYNVVSDIGVDIGVSSS